jgi:hypothetical protein
MAPINSEPECWSCRHFERGLENKRCTLHGVVLPTDKGPHIICTRWEHQSDADHAITWWRRKYLTDDTVLYRYMIYSKEVPRPLARFSTLDHY